MGVRKATKWRKKSKFWQYLNEEVEFANNSNAGLVIQFDGNLWAGDGIIPGDPRPQKSQLNSSKFSSFMRGSDNKK